MPFSKHAEALISDLRGLPAPRSRARVRSGTVPLENLVEVALKNYKVGERTVEETIMKNWRAIVGEKTAHRCSPQRIAPGQRLVINAPNSVVRQELQFRKRELLRTIRALPDCERINDILLTHG